MPQIIGSVYEIIREIGSGGGGIVYLAKHLRLGKLVVLKADKRRLSTKPEVLRREVDALKNLSHTYIPQVYDFLEENSTAYTVMDYVEGESFDKLLARGDRFSQAQVAEWARQLLDALKYLHSRPPHGILHGDIKPANIMLTPQGDIRLIDFNIALALGEEGAVRVGLSRGYASPEHYGVDLLDVNRTQGMGDDLVTYVTSLAREDDAPLETVITQYPQSGSRGGYTSGGRTILLDARSDIYSLGATLYHLLSGRRPPVNARDVEPLSEADGVSPQISAIIAKAMDPDPGRRYQRADEMLSAFRHLHENDERVKKLRRRTVVTSAVLIAAFLVGGVCSLLGLRRMERTQETARLEAERLQAQEAAEKEALAAVTASEDAYREGDIPKAISSALDAIGSGTQYSARARKALTDALGVYELSDGFRPRLTALLDSEPLKLSLSPGGKRAAVVTGGSVTVLDTETGERLAELEADRSALSDAVFLSEDTLIYAGAGAVRAYDISGSRELWSGEAGTTIAVSGDGGTVAAVYRDETHAAVYDALTGELRTEVDFDGKHQSVAANDIYSDPGDNLFALSGDGRYLSVSFSDGALSVYDLDEPGSVIEILSQSQYTHFEGGFCGNLLAASMNGSERCDFAVYDLDALSELTAFTGTSALHAYADGSGIYVAQGNLLVSLDPHSGKQTERAYTDTDIVSFTVGEEYTLAVTKTGGCHIFDSSGNRVDTLTPAEGCDYAAVSGDTAVLASLNSPRVRVLALERHDGSIAAVYDPEYEHDEARLSTDGETLTLFSYRGFRVCSVDATPIAEVELPDAAEVYDQQYIREEALCVLEVIYNSGLVRRYSAADGALLSEEQGEAPDPSLEDSFGTERYLIKSPLHGTPEVYDRQTGELVRLLEPDAYLTYVTETGGYIITEYISAQGERYGLLLDGSLETLAYLPNLCDILPDGTLLFDDTRGTLRQSRIYSVEELIALSEK